MTGWQPIESAPKDGTQIDVWVYTKTPQVLNDWQRQTAERDGKLDEVLKNLADAVGVEKGYRVPDAVWWPAALERTNKAYGLPYEKPAGREGWMYYDGPGSMEWCAWHDGMIVSHWMPLPEHP